MNHKKICLITLATFSFVSCGSNGWNENEKQIINEEFYGIEIPYYHIENMGELTWSTAFSIAYIDSGISTKKALDEYAKLFDDTWDDYSCVDPEEVEQTDTYYYYFEKKVETDGGERWVDVTFFGEDLDIPGLPSNDGSGTFYLEISDPYFYSWPSDEIKLLSSNISISSKIPVYEQADRYELATSYYAYGEFAIYCYNSPTSSLDDYASALTDIDYVYYGEAEDGALIYISKDLDVEIDILYDSSPQYKSLDIYIYSLAEEYLQ